MEGMWRAWEGMEGHVEGMGREWEGVGYHVGRACGGHGIEKRSQVARVGYGLGVVEALTREFETKWPS